MGNTDRYCTSVYKYYPEPQASENTAHECNTYPYCPLTQVISCLLCTKLKNNPISRFRIDVSVSMYTCSVYIYIYCTCRQLIKYLCETNTPIVCMGNSNRKSINYLNKTSIPIHDIVVVSFDTDLLPYSWTIYVRYKWREGKKDKIFYFESSVTILSP